MRATRARLLAGLLAAVLVAGAVALRAQLVSDLRWEPPPSATSSPGGASAGASATPGGKVVVLPPGATPVATPAAPGYPGPGSPVVSAPPTPPPRGTPLARILLPWLGNGQAPTPPDTRLTPEARPTPTPAPPPAPTAPPVTPTPTATRVPMRPTKLGVGVYDSGGAFLPVLDALRPSVILLMDPSLDFAREVRRMFPRAFIMGRIYDPAQPLDNPAQRGEAFADRVAQSAVPLKGVVDAWMGYNEITGHNDYNNYRAYNAFQVAFANRLQGHYGIDAVAGNDGTGTIDPPDYAKYFAESIRASKYLGIHSYAPNGENSMRTAAAAHLVLRHRQIRDALVAAGIPVRQNQFIITESGLWDGWRGVVSDDEMAADYIWFGEELNKDSYVLGTTIYGVFQSDRWRNFNVSGTSIVPRIGAYNTEGWRP